MGITIPVVPGIMPIVNFSSLVRFSDMCGAEIPRWIRKQLEAYGDDTDSIRKFGEDVVTEMCEKLLKGRGSGVALLYPEPGRTQHFHLEESGNQRPRKDCFLTGILQTATKRGFGPSFVF